MATTFSPKDISSVNVEELIRSHCGAKVNSLEADIHEYASKLAMLVMESARLKAHALIQEHFDAMETKANGKD